MLVQKKKRVQPPTPGNYTGTTVYHDALTTQNNITRSSVQIKRHKLHDPNRQHNRTSLSNKTETTFLCKIFKEHFHK